MNITSDVSLPTNWCYHFWHHGTCKFGVKCFYEHVRQPFICPHETSKKSCARSNCRWCHTEAEIKIHAAAHIESGFKSIKGREIEGAGSVACQSKKKAATAPLAVASKQVWTPATGTDLGLHDALPHGWCYTFYRYGNCAKDKDCAYEHVKEPRMCRNENGKKTCLSNICRYCHSKNEIRIHAQAHLEAGFTTLHGHAISSETGATHLTNAEKLAWWNNKPMRGAGVGVVEVASESESEAESEWEPEPEYVPESEPVPVYVPVPVLAPIPAPVPTIDLHEYKRVCAAYDALNENARAQQVALQNSQEQIQTMLTERLIVAPVSTPPITPSAAPGGPPPYSPMFYSLPQPPPSPSVPVKPIPLPSPPLVDGLDSEVHHILNLLGLERLAGVFREHEIDYEALTMFKMEEYKELGLALGPRTKLFNYMKNLASITIQPRQTK